MNKEIPEITDAEEMQIRDEYDRFVKGNGHNSKALHLPADGDEIKPLCDCALRNEGCALNGNQGKTDWGTKDPAVYPPGYYDICKFCVQRWRDDE